MSPETARRRASSLVESISPKRWMGQAAENAAAVMSLAGGCGGGSRLEQELDADGEDRERDGRGGEDRRSDAEVRTVQILAGRLHHHRPDEAQIVAERHDAGEASDEDQPEHIRAQARLEHL